MLDCQHSASEKDTTLSEANKPNKQRENKPNKLKFSDRQNALRRKDRCLAPLFVQGDSSLWGEVPEALPSPLHSLSNSDRGEMLGG